MTPNEKFKERVLETSENLILQDVDGFYYFCPADNMFTSHYLRIVADELDKRNKPWNDYIAEHLNEHIKG